MFDHNFDKAAALLAVGGAVLSVILVVGSSFYF